MQVDPNLVFSRAWCVCLLVVGIFLDTRVNGVVGTHQGIPVAVVKLWASAFGGEMKSISAKYSGSQLLQKKYKEFERAVRVEEINGLRLVKRLADDMEDMFRKKAEAMESSSSPPPSILSVSLQHFRQRLDKLFAKGIGMLDVALTEAFNLLNDVNGRGSVCSQAIMLVTDGAVDTYDAVFAKYNWPDRKVRIFPYLIGRESAFADNLKWMACANKGYFTQISTLADVQENVMEYLHVLSRPKVIDQEHETVWTEAYIDSTLPQAQKMDDGHSPVLMTTVAMPVFSTKNETRNRGILLGVVGTDIPVSELLKTIPKYKLGIHGYAFAITNNGYILTHPDLRPLYEESKKRRKPNYSSVDLSEVEWEDKEDILRNAMVNRKTGTFSMEVKKTVDKGKRVLVLHNDYYYTDIKGTPFSLGVALTRGHGKYFFRGNVTVEEGLHDLEHPDVALADEWTYCDTDEHPEHRYLSQIEAIKLYLSRRETHLSCDKELVQEVLFDAVVTAPLEAYWTSLVLNKSENSDKGVEIAYLGTRTGLSRINLFVPPDLLTNQDFLTAEDKEGVFNADHFPLWYKRAAEQVPGTFVYSLPFSTGSENKSVVLASTAIQLLDERKSPIAAGDGVLQRLLVVRGGSLGPLPGLSLRLRLLVLLQLPLVLGHDGGVGTAVHGGGHHHQEHDAAHHARDHHGGDGVAQVHRARTLLGLALRQAAPAAPAAVALGSPQGAVHARAEVGVAPQGALGLQVVDVGEQVVVAGGHAGPTSGLSPQYVLRPAPGPTSGLSPQYVLRPAPGPTSGLSPQYVLRPAPGPTSGLSPQYVLRPAPGPTSEQEGLQPQLEPYEVAVTPPGVPPQAQPIQATQPFQQGAVHALQPSAAAQRLGRTMLVPCDTEYPAFVSERTIKETTGNIDCEDCIKSFVIQQIPSSNLFMVVVDNKCDCESAEPITMDPIEIMYIESLKCERLKYQKDRRRPDTCHPFHPEENSMECGGALGLSPSLTATLLCVSLALFHR
ncbi:voltage-dependent calcium channel subunit alpha-2/delta-3-like [Osmerus eperlanus]|uniref:voltage-dependent calcium channel subunit alpha-2/delta-3-like n=1 Tax=Osmerus eperlanus TaxID=29151 RepID=UPI002E159AEA